MHVIGGLGAGGSDSAPPCATMAANQPDVNLSCGFLGQIGDVQCHLNK